MTENIYKIYSLIQSRVPNINKIKKKVSSIKRNFSIKNRKTRPLYYLKYGFDLYFTNESFKKKNKSVRIFFNKKEIDKEINKSNKDKKRKEKGINENDPNGLDINSKKRKKSSSEKIIEKKTNKEKNSIVNNNINNNYYYIFVNKTNNQVKCQEKNKEKNDGYGQNSNINGMSKYPPRPTRHFLSTFNLINENNFSSDNNFYTKTNKDIIPNIFYKHLLTNFIPSQNCSNDVLNKYWRNNNEVDKIFNNSVYVSVKNRTKSKLLTFIYVSPKI